MPSFFCALLLGCSLFAEGESSVPQTSHPGNGSFYVNGIVYQYVAGADYTVVAAAHSVINHKFVGVKVRVFNEGQQSVTVKPEEVSVEDAVAGQSLHMVSGTQLAGRMRRPYNWARLAVNQAAGVGGYAHDRRNAEPPVPRNDARDGSQGEWGGNSNVARK